MRGGVNARRPGLHRGLAYGNLPRVGLGWAFLGMPWPCGHNRRENIPGVFGSLESCWLECRALQSLLLGGIVISAGVIMHRAVVVAVSSPVGAGEIFHTISEIGVGIAQPFGSAGVAKPAHGRELDLHQ